MSGKKQFDRIAWVITALTLAVTILFMNGSAFGAEVMAHNMGYEDRLFDSTKVHTIDIVMDDWEEFIANATREEYYAANVVIDGEAYKNVGIRAKGNTSLSTVAALGSQRYSFKIEFDQYDSAKSYYGLDKLSLNNLIQDSTMMKDYLTYALMNEFGVNASLYSFVYLTVNGEDWGLYLAVEGVEDAFLERNYGSDYGELYKPDSMSFGGGRGNGEDFDMEGFGSGGGGQGSADVKLMYIDDEFESYSNIWSNAKTDITDGDQSRLIASLKKLSAGEDIESVVDVEQVIRYFVVHNYVCNDDSYTGMMVHNYYLYEEEGRLAMIPWDYNLAFGTFGSGDGDSTVNTPIDAPVSGGSSDRPMLNWIFEEEKYTQMYHRYFSQFLETVDIAGIIEDAYNRIKTYVEKDPTAFYSYEEFELGVETLRQFCELRSESISMQLANGETASNMSYVDASGITLSDMGSMGGGMGGGGMGGPGGEMGGFDPSNMPEEFDPSERPEGFDPSNMPEGFDPSEQPEGFDSSNMPDNIQGDFPETPTDGSDRAGEADPESSADDSDARGGFGTNRPNGGNMQMLGGGAPFDMGSAASPSDLTGWIWIAVSAVVLMAGLVIAKKYKG